MRDKDYETMIEIPLSEFRQLVEDNAENRLHMRKAIEDLMTVKFELEEMKTAHSKLTDLYEQAVVELESYKKIYDKEKK